MWKFVSVPQNNQEDIARYLKEGYEPFTVTTGAYGFAIIWLKKEEVTEEQKKQNKLILESYIRRINEANSQSVQSDTGASNSSIRRAKRKNSTGHRDS